MSRRLWLLVLLGTVAVGIEPAYGASGQDLVSTPGGPCARQDVHEIEPGQLLVERAGRYDILDAHRRLVRTIPKRETMRPMAQANGWVTYSAFSNDTGSPISSFQSTWVVPPAPTTDSGQLIYYFNGLEPPTGAAILQPVLQWGASPAGGGSYWGVANWYVTADGQAMHSRLVPVNPGDTLVGVMKRTSADGAPFSYSSEFSGIADSKLSVEDISELTWASETLEAYDVSDCSDYPAAPTAFTAIGLATAVALGPIDWQVENQVTDCGQHTSIVSDSPTSGEVDLFTQ